MKLKTALASLAALSLATAPAVAQEINLRAAAPIAKGEAMGEQSGWLALLAVVGAVTIFIVTADDDTVPPPVSP